MVYSNPRRLPQEWIDTINDRYYQAPSREAWADFNCAWKAYFSLRDVATQPLGIGIYETTDVPSAPVIADFLDLLKARDCTRVGGAYRGADAGLLPSTPYGYDAGMLPPTPWGFDADPP